LTTAAFAKPAPIQPTLALRRRTVPLWIDCTIALLLFLSAGIWGTVSWKRSVTGGQPFYYQHYFEPAVMIACGKGFVVAQPQVPAMGLFLGRQVDRFSCDAIPRSTTLGTEGLYQGPWRYLMFAVGGAWRLLGVSWSGLGPLFGTLFGATIAGAYAIFRLGTSPVFAAVGAVALSVSKLHLGYLPSLRDYAKAPFTLILIFLLGLLVKRRTTWRGTLAIAAAYGAILGIGYGFRTDFLADVPLFFLTLIGFLEGGLFRNMRLKIAAGAVCAATFLVTAWPVVASVSRSGGCQWHTVLLGFSKDFAGPLDVDDPPYDLSRQYLDEFVFTTVTSSAARVQPGVGHIEYCQPQYDRATGRFLIDLVKRFPADMVVRAYASTVRIVELPFTWRDPGRAKTGGLQDQPPNPDAGHGIGLALIITTIGLAAAVSTRIGLFLLFWLLYFGGYPAIQFDARHYFHLEFITWWAAFFVLQFVISDLWPMVRDQRRTISASVRRAVLAVAACGVGLVLALWGARAYQQVAVRSLLQSYLAAPKDEVPLHALSGTFLPIARASPRTDPETADFLEVDLNGWRCGEHPAITFRYGLPARRDFSRTFTLQRHDDFHEPTRVFMPVYDGFEGIEFPDPRPGCIDGVYRVRDPGKFTLLLEAALPPGWQRSPLYQRLRGAGPSD
jgi:hypothetical protein